MSYTLIDNTPKIEFDTSQRASIFLRFMTEEIIRISTPKTPKRTGRLRMDVIKQVLGLSGKVEWGKNYAIYQEKKQYSNYTTPGTGPKYAENSVNEAVNNTETIARRAQLI